jgi:hypothetical protein
MDILRCTSLICNKLHVLNKLAWLLTRVSRHHHVYAFQNTYLVQSMEWRYVHTCSFIYHTGKIHRITPFWCWVLFNLSTFYDRCYMSNRSKSSKYRSNRSLLGQIWLNMLNTLINIPDQLPCHHPNMLITTHIIIHQSHSHHHNTITHISVARATLIINNTLTH